MFISLFISLSLYIYIYIYIYYYHIICTHYSLIHHHMARGISAFPGIAAFGIFAGSLISTMYVSMVFTDTQTTFMVLSLKP